MRVEAKISVRDAYTVYASLANKNSFEKITDLGPATALLGALAGKCPLLESVD